MKRKLIIGISLVFLLTVAAGASAFSYALSHRTVGKFFDSNGVQIHYTDEGKGEPVILIHGFGANADINWRKPGIIDRLAKEYRVIALDNRGHGLSGKPHEREAYGLEMVQDVVRLMDHLEIEKAHIVGYSMGGYITMKMLTMYPERFLSAAPLGAGWPRRYPERVAMLEALVTSIKEKGNFEPLIQMLHKDNGASWWHIKTVNLTLNYINDCQALSAVIAGFFDFECDEDALRGIQVPVLSVVGDKDPLISDAEAMVGIVPHQHLVRVSGGDHITTVGSPELINALIEHIKKHPAGAPHEATPAEERAAEAA